MYELYIEGQRADIDDSIGIQLSFSIDDVSDFASRNTGFSKTIVLPGTAKNNAIFGHIHELGSANVFAPGQPNIGGVFNVAQTARAELRLNGLLVLRGVFRLTKIVKTNTNRIEYEGAVFGELSGLIAKISNKRLEDLDFSAYDHTYNHTAVENSWNNPGGSGYFYPLIDYGSYRDSNDDDYQIGTFRPALYVKEYIDKMFAEAGYSYESSFINSAMFKSLIIPHNTKQLTKLATRLLTATATNQSFSFSGTRRLIQFDTAIGGNFTITGTNSLFTYNVADSVSVRLRLRITATYTATEPFDIQLQRNSIEIEGFSFPASATAEPLDITIDTTITLNNADALRVAFENEFLGAITITNLNAEFFVDASVATTTLVASGDTVSINDTIPRGIFQRDFFASILRMFNLYVTEDKLDEKKLLIKPYKDFYDTSSRNDWTYKVARNKAWNITPMGQLNGRIFDFKYKEDSDFYNEQYKKKYNQTYGDRQFDTGFQFSKDRVSTEIIFSPSPLIQYTGDDKRLTAIYKKSNSLSAEDRMDSNIRILFSKKITNITSWRIKNGNTNHEKTGYGYAGHLDNPDNPVYDLNFGAPSEVYATITTYPSRNLFNEYWSEYIAEIADKDSKILSCHVYLTPLDIAQLDFSKQVMIDGVVFRINKVSDYDYTNNDLVKVELLKVINNG